MRYLTCLLVAEGPFDVFFLPPLLQRAAVALMIEDYDVDAEVSVRHIDVDHQRPADITAALGKQVGLFDLLLYHHDGAPQDVASQKIAEVTAQWNGRFSEPVVPVVPVRETEAWILADLATLTDVMRLPDERISRGVPGRARDVEGIGDPKALLSQLFDQASGGRRRLQRFQQAKQAYLTEIAEHISLARLCEVPSFTRWRADMANALDRLGFKHG